MQFQLASAQAAEKDSAIDELKSVIMNKDTMVVELQMQMAKLMERLSDAELKVFELQDQFTDDGKSQRSNRSNYAQPHNSQQQ